MEKDDPRDNFIRSAMEWFDTLAKRRLIDGLIVPQWYVDAELYFFRQKQNAALQKPPTNT